MEKPQFKEDEIYFPCTMQQFQDLVNEMLEEVNKVCAPFYLNSDYMANIVMSALHAIDHKYGTFKKSLLFESCINRTSSHVTFHAVEEIRKRLQAEEAKAKAAAGEPHLAVVPEPIAE